MYTLISKGVSERINSYVYHVNQVHDKKSAVKFLLTIRNKKDILVKHIDLDDGIRQSEGSKATILSATVPEARLMNEVISRNIDQITLFGAFKSKSFLLQINLLTWEVTIILNMKSPLKIEELEMYLFA